MHIGGRQDRHWNKPFSQLLDFRDLEVIWPYMSYGLVRSKREFEQLTGLVYQIWLHWVHSLCLDYFVCVRLFSCVISACMLYYCNTVRWAWLDRGLFGWLTTLLQCFDTVGWVTRPVKTVGRITYIVLVQTLNHAQSINQSTVTLILDRVIQHTIVYHSSTSTYIPNFVQIVKTFLGQMDVWMDGRDTEIGCIKSTRRRQLYKCLKVSTINHVYYRPTHRKISDIYADWRWECKVCRALLQLTYRPGVLGIGGTPLTEWWRAASVGRKEHVPECRASHGSW